VRYLRLYLYFLRFSISRAAEFRVDFYFRVVMDCIYYAVNIAFFGIVYSQTTLVGGWTEEQAYVFVCGFLFVDAVHMTIFANNMWMLPVLINKGDLDYYLLRPVSSLFFLSVREFAANSFLNLVIAAGLVVWSLWQLPGGVDVGRAALFVLFLLNGALIVYLFRLIFITPVFWLHSSRGLDELNWMLERFSERPHQIYSTWLQRFLLTLLPFAFLSSIPAHVLFEGLTVERLLHTVAVTGGLGAFALWLWRRGLRAYSSASS
jgi:ABC-2 type transport system permease protein